MCLTCSQDLFSHRGWRDRNLSNHKTDDLPHNQEGHSADPESLTSERSSSNYSLPI